MCTNGHLRNNHAFAFLAFVSLIWVVAAGAADEINDARYTNFLGMEFVRVEPGTFRMGQIETPLPLEILPYDGGKSVRMDFLADGDFDEQPVHAVKISRPFHVAVCEVTNAQYEIFDPSHRALRGKYGVSSGDDEAVVFVNWYDAMAFCRWLSDKDPAGLRYRLPTEAEWEYACRAGTESNYHTGDTLPQSYLKAAYLTKEPVQVSLEVAKTCPNAWGIYDMHGNVEEWCLDWYGPYPAGRRIDPVGYADGDFRVLRGGSYGTYAYYLRSANRMGALPAQRHWLYGFRPVIAPMPTTKLLERTRVSLDLRSAAYSRDDIVRKGPDPAVPYFTGPKKYVKIPTGSIGPLFASHNHDPAVAACPNGDILAIWYTCVAEKNRELGVVASRLRYGTDCWEPACPWWDAPDRNDHAPALWFDGEDTIYHFNSLSGAGGYDRLAVIMRTSTDSGATWSRARLILPDHTSGHQINEPVFRTLDGAIAVTVDGPNTLFFSHDNGLTWTNPGGDVPGIHAGIAQLPDGRILALNREEAIDGYMPISVSEDGGKSFTSRASDFPAIGGGQRAVLLKLAEGPLLFASFADNGIDITDISGTVRRVKGLYAAVSTDGGKTWPHRRLVSDDGPSRPVECTDGGLFTLSANSGEYRGYLSVCQAPDGVIHLISSRQHYAFNLAWLTAVPPTAGDPLAVIAAVETFNGPEFDLAGWADYRSYNGNFTGDGAYRIQARQRGGGINRIVGAGSFEVVVKIDGIRFQQEPSEGMPCQVELCFQDGIGAKFCTTVNRKYITVGERPDYAYGIVPESLIFRFAWNRSEGRARIFIGLNGSEPTTELAASQEGIFVPGAGLGESTAFFVLVTNADADIRHFELKCPDNTNSQNDMD